MIKPISNEMKGGYIPSPAPRMRRRVRTGYSKGGIAKDGSVRRSQVARDTDPSYVPSWVKVLARSSTSSTHLLDLCWLLAIPAPLSEW